MYDILTSQATKWVMISFSWAFYQVSDLTGGIIDRGFDQAFSIGLLVAAVVFFIVEKHLDNKHHRGVISKLSDYNQDRDKRMEKIMEDNTKMMSGVTASLESLTKVIERL